MKMKKIIAGVIIAAGMIAVPAVTYAYDDGDFQVWLKAEVSGKLENGLIIAAEEELKYGDNASEFYDQETALSVGYAVNSWLKIGVGYKVVQERKNKTVVTPKTASDGTVTYSSVGDGDHYWQNEERPFGDLVFSTKLAGWKLEDRTRFEWRMKDDGGDAYLRFRNRVKAKSPWKWTKFDINPYIAWEANFEDKDGLSGSDKWDRHRGFIGFTMSLYDRLNGGLYYCLQADRSGDDWNKSNVAGFELGVKF